MDSYSGIVNHELYIGALSKKMSKYKIEGNKVIFPSGEVAEMSSSFIKRKFNGLIFVSFDPVKNNFYSPAPVWVESFGVQYEVHPIGFWKESLIETFMKLPACVKY